MERCTDDVAIAIRLGHVELVHSLLMTRAMARVEKEAASFMQKSRRPPNSGRVQEWMRDGFLGAILDPLDEDRNNAMHYCCYCESSEILSFILMQVGVDYELLVLQTNAQELLPMDYCRIANDSSFLERIEMVTETAKQQRQERQITNRLCNLMARLNVLQLTYSWSAFLFGWKLFGHGPVVAAIAVCAAQILQGVVDGEDFREGDSGPVMLCILHLTWELLLFSYSLCGHIYAHCVGLVGWWLVSAAAILAVVFTVSQLVFLLRFLPAFPVLFARQCFDDLPLMERLSSVFGPKHYASVRQLLILALYAALVCSCHATLAIFGGWPSNELFLESG